MKLRVLSDLHLEHGYGYFNIPKLPEDKETILILAGDIGVLELPNTYEDFIRDACQQFKHVFWVYGNHEFYRGIFSLSSKIAEDVLNDVDNLTMGIEFEKVIDDIAFVGSTLWTNFEKDNASSHLTCSNSLNDFKLISVVIDDELTKRFSTYDALNFFNNSVENYIKPKLMHHKQEGRKTVLISHHAPSFQSIGAKYTTDPCNGAFASDLTELLRETTPVYAIHGHVHSTNNYKVFFTKVICNPCGYPNEQNDGFNPILTLEI